MEKELFEMCFELEDIESVQEDGYKNMYDITVSGEKTFLLDNGIVSHNSALGGIVPALGRKDIGYMALKGKPLNVISATQSKFVSNAEMSLLYKIANNEGYKNIIFATDSDVDGIHIQGLLIGMISKFLPDYLNHTGILQTPILAIKKNNKLHRWTYSLNDRIKPKKDEKVKWMKGLGSWNEKDLKEVVKTDGFENMIEYLEFDSDEIINEWLLDKNTDIRKEYIQNNEFDITKV